MVSYTVLDRLAESLQEGLPGFSEHNRVNTIGVFEHVPEISVIERWHVDETYAALSIVKTNGGSFFKAVDSRLEDVGSEFAHIIFFWDRIGDE